MGLLAVLMVAGMAYQFTPGIRSGDMFGQTSGTPALKVNGQTVTVEELTNAKRGNALMAANDTGVLGDDFKIFAVAAAIRNAVVRDAAKDISVSRAEVNDEVTKIREANNLQDNKAWVDALQGINQTDSSFRQQTRDQLAVQRKADEIKKGAAAVTDAEARTYYDLHRDEYQSDARIVGRQIVVSDKAKAAQLLQKVRAGEDFAKLATENSTVFKDRGGALGPIENGAPKPVAKAVLPNAVADAAFALTNGGVTDVVEDGGKFYIVKVEKFLAAAPKTFEEVKTEVMNAAKAQKENQALEVWLDGLRQNAKIEFVDPEWKVEDPTVAEVAGQKIPYSDVIAQVLGNQQLAAIYQQLGPEQLPNIINTSLKPGIVAQLIDAHAAPKIAQSLKLPLVGSRQDQAIALNNYAAKDVVVTEDDIQKFYQANVKQFETPAGATVDEASFKDRNQAAAFRADWDGSGDFVTAATKAGGTVAERGAVAPGDQKLDAKLSTAVFEGSLRSAGEGSLSEVVPVGGRYSVAYVKDLKKAGTTPLSEVRSQIETQVLATKKAEASQAFMKKHVEPLKPVDRLKEVLEAQAKRVAAAEKTAATTAPDSGAAGTGTTTPPAQTPPAQTAPAKAPAQGAPANNQ